MYSAAQHIYIANAKYLENFKEQGYNVMFKYILCKLAITNRQAIHSTFCFKLELQFCAKNDFTVTVVQATSPKLCTVTVVIALCNESS